MTKRARWIEIHDELFTRGARTGERVDALACKLAAQQEEQLRDMRRSLQAAEAAIGTTVEDCRREGVSMGRKLANASASVLGARVDELESAARAYLAAVDEESGQAIALDALRKALGGSDA